MSFLLISAFNPSLATRLFAVIAQGSLEEPEKIALNLRSNNQNAARAHQSAITVGKNLIFVALALQLFKCRRKFCVCEPQRPSNVQQDIIELCPLDAPYAQQELGRHMAQHRANHVLPDNSLNLI